MLSEKDLIFLGACLLRSRRPITLAESITMSKAIYEGVFNAPDEETPEEKDK